MEVSNTNIHLNLPRTMTQLKKYLAPSPIKNSGYAIRLKI